MFELVSECVSKVFALGNQEPGADVDELHRQLRQGVPPFCCVNCPGLYRCSEMLKLRCLDGCDGTTVSRVRRIAWRTARHFGGSSA